MANTDFYVTRLNEEHVKYLAKHLRDSDVQEIYDARHLTPIEALKQGLDKSTMAWVVVLNHEPICAFGVVPYSLLSREGVAWMLGTDKIASEAAIRVAAKSRIYVDLMRHNFTELFNYVATDNHVSKKWLEWCGFTLEAPARYGVERKMFNKFHIQGGLYV